MFLLYSGDAMVTSCPISDTSYIKGHCWASTSYRDNLFCVLVLWRMYRVVSPPHSLSNK
jgi:hypothetical protein